MEEIGPFRLERNSSKLSLNVHSWNKVANVLFLESPAAEDAAVFLEQWMRRFPHYRERELYIAGESYAGHYVPQLARRVLLHGHLRLKGYIVGNALLDHDADRLGRVDYWWAHALISRRTHAAILRSCNLGAHRNGALDACVAAVRTARAELGDVDPYNIYAPVCRRSNKSAAAGLLYDPVWRAAPLYGYDPCLGDYVEKYMNRRDVQHALHANATGIPYPWVGCSHTINNNWQDSEDSMLPTYRKLMGAGLRIWVYSGDVDAVVPVTSSLYSLEKLNLSVSTSWYPWYHGTEVGGYSEAYHGGLTLVTVRGAGHEVPLFQPGRALTIIRNFLRGKPMPSQPKER